MNRDTYLKENYTDKVKILDEIMNLEFSKMLVPDIKHAIDRLRSLSNLDKIIKAGKSKDINDDYHDFYLTYEFSYMYILISNANSNTIINDSEFTWICNALSEYYKFIWQIKAQAHVNPDCITVTDMYNVARMVRTMVSVCDYIYNVGKTMDGPFDIFSSYKTYITRIYNAYEAMLDSITGDAYIMRSVLFYLDETVSRKRCNWKNIYDEENPQISEPEFPFSTEQMECAKRAASTQLCIPANRIEILVLEEEQQSE